MKRVILIFLSLLLTVSMIASTVLAASNTPFYISKQPQDVFAEEGERVSFSVIAVGDGLSYSWEYRNPGSTVWRSAGVSSSTYSMTLEGRRDGFSLRCVVTDSFGRSITSRIASCYIGTNMLNLYASQALTHVLEWGEIVFSALFSPSGALFPLLSVLGIGVAVAAIFFVIRVFKFFSWGV